MGSSARDLVWWSAAMNTDLRNFQKQLEQQRQEERDGALLLVKCGAVLLIFTVIQLLLGAFEIIG